MVEEGDGDQAGLKIVVGDDAIQTWQSPALVRPAVYHRAAALADSCRDVKVSHVERGRHGRRVRVSSTVRKCEGARFTPAVDARPCKRHGRRHVSCEATAEKVRISDEHVSRHERHHRADDSDRHEHRRRHHR